MYLIDNDCQASRIIRRFGGVDFLCRALAALGPEQIRDRSTLYRWTYPRDRGGCGGLVPTSAMPAVLAAARLQGIVLTAEDVFPA